MCRKAFLVAIAIATSTIAIAQQRAVGLRVGDPIGVTFKSYVQPNKAVEFILGTASPNWRKNYYEKSFDKYDKYDGYTYQSHKLNNPVYLVGRYLLHNQYIVEGMEGKLEWYWGAGAMLKFGKMEYRYHDSDNAEHTDKRNALDFGPEGIIGVEYTFEDVPLNVFGETSLLIELADRPFALQLFGGVGARFLF